MGNLFSTVLNMSMTGSVAILLVMLARLILKRAPKIFSYALWSVVLFRLLCPVAFTAPVSVLNALEPEVQGASESTSVVYFIPAEVNQNPEFTFVPAENQSGMELVQAGESEHTRLDLITVASYVWITGTGIMILYSIIQYIRLRGKLVGAMAYRGNVYRADYIDTPFVIGIFSPKIYLPSDVPMNERKYIIAHEQHHIRRCDHIIKLLAYLSLCIHWFNPLVWAAFILAGKDMEMSCDEAVIRKLGEDVRAEYSATLLNLATGHRIIAGTPLAFGEGDPKGRIRNLANWRKPTMWLVSICVILCLCIAVVCAFNPEKKEERSIEELTRRTSDGPVDTAIGDLCFIYPGGLTSEQRDVDNWSEVDRTRSLRDLPTRRPYDHFFIDNGADFGGVVDFIVPEDREIRLEEMNLPSEWVGLDYIAGSSTYPYAEMEYTLFKDDKDYIQLYQYTYSGRGYFLWFYTDQGNPAHKESILKSVELGSFSTTATKLKRDEIVSLGQFNMTILKGYGYHRKENKILEITRKGRLGEQVVVGCVTARPNPNLPLETDADWVDWVEAVGLDLHLDDPNYGYTITDNGEFGDISLTLEEMSDKKLLMSERHYFYIAGDIVYHLWFDAMEMNWADDKQMIQSIWIKENYKNSSENDAPTTVGIPQPMEETESYMPTIPASDIDTDTQLVSYGSLKMLLPSSFATFEDGDIVVLTKDSVAVGGIRSWNSSEFQPSDIVELKKEESGVPIGYMSTSSTYGDMEYEVFWDGNPDRLNEKHTFFTDGDIIYDVWYDQNLISAGIAERFLKTVAINADPVVATEPGEQEAFAKCRAVLEAVQKGSYKIIIRQTNGRNENAMSHERTYSRSGADWMSITNVLPMGEDFTGEVEFATTSSTLCVNGKHFHYTGTEWVDIAEIENAPIPWLAEFTWDENIVAYMDTLTDEDGECIMLRVDEQYIDSDDYDPHYFLYFNFDPDGNFVNAQLQINLFRDNELSITESIVSLDPETVNADIQKEYQRAIG